MSVYIRPVYMGNRIRTILFLATTLLIVSGSCAWNHTDVTPQQAKDLINSIDELIVVDIREVDEYCNAIGHIPGALNYPWKTGILQVKYEELPADRPILVVCRRGNRSNQAANFLGSKGHSLVYDMLGGMQAWRWETAFCVDSDNNSINYDLDNYPQ